jgi:hypothetical protein
MEDGLNIFKTRMMTSTKMEEWKTTSKKKKNGRRPQKRKWKKNQLNKTNLIGCDTIVNSPSLSLCQGAK